MSLADLARRPRAAGGTGSAPGRAGGRRGWTARSPSTPTSASAARVVDGLHALDDDLARPLVPDPGEVLVGRPSGRTSCRAARATVPDQRSSDANASGSVVRKLNHHPGRGIALSDRARRQGRRDRHAVALVAQPRARDRDVDGDQQRVEAGLGRPVDQRHRPVAVLPHVELEPVAAVRVRRRDVLDRGGAHRRQRERDAGAAAAAGAPAISPSVCIIRVKPVGAMPNGSARRAAQHLDATCRPSTTSRRIAGWNSMSSNAWRARASEISPSAAPSV